MNELYLIKNCYFDDGHIYGAFTTEQEALNTIQRVQERTGENGYYLERIDINTFYAAETPPARTKEYRIVANDDGYFEIWDDNSAHESSLLWQGEYGDISPVDIFDALGIEYKMDKI